MNKNNCVILYLVSKWGKSVLGLIALMFGIVIVLLGVVYGVSLIETFSLYLFNSSDMIWYLVMIIAMMIFVISTVKDLIIIALKDVKNAKEGCK